jgi:hypothetical protein
MVPAMMLLKHFFLFSTLMGDNNEGGNFDEPVHMSAQGRLEGQILFAAAVYVFGMFFTGGLIVITFVTKTWYAFLAAVVAIYIVDHLQSAIKQGAQKTALIFAFIAQAGNACVSLVLFALRGELAQTALFVLTATSAAHAIILRRRADAN